MSIRTIVSSIIVFLSVFGSVQAVELPYKPGELLVRFAPKVDRKQRTLAERNAVLGAIGGGTVKYSYKFVPGLTVVKLPVNRTVENLLPAFKTAEGILYAEPNYRIKYLSTFPNDSRFDELYGMHNTGQTGGTPNADIDAPEAWDIVTDTNIIVAVIDSGVDYKHPDLADNIWTNEDELYGDPNVDDDVNGYIDDVYGYDFGSGDGDPMDYYPHGTHCAGIAGAVGNNGEGVTGVCWNVRIMAVKIGTDYGPPNTDAAIAGIEYALEMGAKVLSNSWVVPYSQPLNDAIDAADANGVLFIAAAGNDYGNNNDLYPIYPCSYECRKYR